MRKEYKLNFKKKRIIKLDIKKKFYNYYIHQVDYKNYDRFNNDEELLYV